MNMDCKISVFGLHHRGKLGQWRERVEPAAFVFFFVFFLFSGYVLFEANDLAGVPVADCFRICFAKVVKQRNHHDNGHPKSVFLLVSGMVFCLRGSRAATWILSKGILSSGTHRGCSFSGKLLGAQDSNSEGLEPHEVGVVVLLFFVTPLIRIYVRFRAD